MYCIHKLGIDFIAGTDITEAARAAINIAIDYNSIVTFNFNGVEIVINTNSSIKDIEKQYYIKLRK